MTANLDSGSLSVERGMAEVVEYSGQSDFVGLLMVQVGRDSW